MRINQRQRATRDLMRQIAGEQKPWSVFADSLSGDLARFRLLRELRKLYTLEQVERLIWDEATP